jgi:hypothetical protein
MRDPTAAMYRPKMQTITVRIELTQHRTVIEVPDRENIETSISERRVELAADSPTTSSCWPRLVGQRRHRPSAIVDRRGRAVLGRDWRLSSLVQCVGFEVK